VNATARARLDARPARAGLRPGDRVELLLDSPADGDATITISHLGDQVREVTASLIAGRDTVDLGMLDEGGYAVTVRLGSAVATTAVDVLVDPNTRPRYGFVTDFQAGRGDISAVTDSLRAFHISHVQFYDWMYRHADLLPPQDDFVDALGRPLSMATVRDFVVAIHDAGAQALAYAAVYGAGREHADAHPQDVLQHRDGTPWMLGDFLWIMVVSRTSPWAAHIVEQMGRAVETIGFDGLHLDQYGDPKIALTPRRSVVDLAEELPYLIDAVRARLPHATLIFNNVNDFPTRSTAKAQQDATYIEVWSPHDHYMDLVDLVRAARDLAPERPAILAAYLKPFALACGEPEVTAAKLALSTVWAAGGQYLLFGEERGALVHPYYPNYATLDDSAVVLLRAFTDFSVANGDLLFPPQMTECTASLTLGINEDVIVTGVPVSTRPEAGSVWVRISSIGTRLVVQLVDYRAQLDARWNAPRNPTSQASGVGLRLRIASPTILARFGHPLGGPHLSTVPVQIEDEYATVTLPTFDTWGLLVIDR